MSTRIKLDFTATDDSLPRVRRIDPLVNKGSLALLDFTSPSMPSDWGGVLSGRIPNLAWGPLAQLLGSGSEDSLSFSYARTLDDDHGLVERTANEGLHVAITQKAWDARQSVAIANPAVAGYLRANPGHSYFMSLWGTLTQDDANTGTPGANMRMAGFMSGTSDVMNIRRGKNYALFPEQNRVGMRQKPNRDVGTPFIVNGAMSQLAPAPDGDTIILWTTGGGSGGQVVMPSWVLYRFYVEDLTESGRTYAQADAADLDYYSTVVQTPGNRYYGDSWTNPGTL